MPEDTTQKSATGASRSFSVSRRQLLGTAAAGAAVTTLPSLPAFAQDAGHTVDVLLVGGGIMSATLGVLLSELEPGWTYHMVERLDAVAEESSNGWNNAGTGHSALCELNYSPMDANGDIHIEKAIDINEQWQLTRQFLAYQVERGVLSNPRSFLNSTPHMSFVWGDENVDFLTKRFAALQTSPLFAGMQFSTDHAKIAEWVPLMMEGRDPNQKLAATWSPLGTDANWGEVTRQYIAHLNTLPNFKLQTGTEVTDIARNDDNTWRVTVEPTDGGEAQVINAKYLFLGAGGGALPLLQMSGIPEGDAYAGFPVGGSFLVCENPEVAEQHLAKAYGQASTGAPPMSVPHLDTRVLDGKRMVLFGPFATFSTKFLKNGSYFDLPASVTLDNIWPMMKVGFTEFNLVEYLAGQLMLSQDDRVAALKEYYPEARAEDWTFWQAGQRVQIIKADPEKGGVLKLGTELVASEDGTLTALLGASPGASTAAPIMLNWLKRVMPQKLETAEWQARMTEIIPSYGQPLNDNPEMLQAQWNRTAEVLELALAMPVINEDQLQQRQDDYQSPSGTVTPRSDIAL